MNRRILSAFALAVMVLFGSADAFAQMDPMMYLPFPYGTEVKCVQGNNGSYSHSGKLAYAFDFVSSSGNGFGLSILSPANAQVVDARDGAPDYSNNDSSNNQNNGGWGNTVMLRDLATNVYIRIAHMKNGSVSSRVKVGDVVAIGQKLGEMGQSGLSTAPHTHIQAQFDSAWGGQSVLMYFIEGLVDKGTVIKSENETATFILDDSGIKSLSHKVLSFSTMRNWVWSSSLSHVPNSAAGYSYATAYNGYNSKSSTPYFVWRFTVKETGYYLIHARYVGSYEYDPYATYSMDDNGLYAILNQTVKVPGNWGFLFGRLLSAGVYYEIRLSPGKKYRYLFGDALKFRKVW